MSDYEDLQLHLSKNDPGESPHHNHYLWMAHWMKASTSAELQNGTCYNRIEDVSKGTKTRDTESLPFEFVKSIVAERFMLGVSRGSASVQHAHQFNSSMWGVAHDVCNELGPAKGDESFKRCMNKKALNLHARAVVSETYSVHRLSDLQLDFQKVGSSDDPGSDWSHFPMFEINRKIDNILNPKRRSGLGPALLNLNMSTSHVVARSSQEYRMQSQCKADKNMDTCTPEGGTVSRLEDPAGLSLDPSGQKLKRQLSDTMSCSCSKDDNNSSDCPIDEQHTSHYFANPKHELPCASNKKKSKLANQVLRAWNNQKIRRSAVHKQQDAAEAMFCAPVLGREFQNESINISNNSKKDGENFHESYKSHAKAISSSLLPYEQQHLETQRIVSAANLKECMLPDQIANKLTEMNNGELHTYGQKSKKMHAGSCNLRGSCLFEKLTIPSKSQSVYPENSASSGKSSGLGVCKYGTNIGSRLFGAQNQSSAKTETLYSDPLIVSKSSAGIASLSAQKEQDYGCSIEAKNEQLATPSVRRVSGYCNDGSHNMNESLGVSFKETVAYKQPCMPGTRSTNVDLILIQTSRMKNPISSGIVQPPVGAEPSDRWLKRLQLDTSIPESPGSKKPKVEDSPPVEQRNSLFGMPLHHSKSDTEMINQVKEDQALDGGSKLQENQEMPPVSGKSMNHWVGRWCQGGVPVFHDDPGQGRQATKPDHASEELGGQFPSIAAMAMMGRAMNKLRPCEHQRKGSFVVWKTD